MVTNPAALAYLEQEVLASDPLGLIARVFELASQQVVRARSAMAARDIAAKGQAVWQVSRCLSMLQCSLNMEQGGAVAANLDRIYNYLLRRLTHAHLQNDDATFAEIGRHLAELGSAWREAARRAPAAQPASASQPARTEAMAGGGYAG